MIGQITTFVVGAGASAPYGLPVASNICDKANNLNPRSPIYQLLLAVIGDMSLVDRVLSDLRSHGAGSIDQFLEHRQHIPETMRVGKALVAALIGEAMAAARPGSMDAPSKSDWIEHVIFEMSRGASRAANFANGAQNVAFITFNFDSCLEERTAQRIHAIYRNDPGVEAALKSIVPTHVHGRVPDPPHEPLQDESRVHGYTATGISGQWIEWTKAAAGNIKVVLEEIDDSVLQQIQNTIAISRVVCFLGFSYDKGNLTKLGFPKTSQTQHQIQYLFGSAYGLRPAQAEQAKDRMGPTVSLILGDAGSKCLDLLLNSHVIRD